MTAPNHHVAASPDTPRHRFYDVGDVIPIDVGAYTDSHHGFEGQIWHAINVAFGVGAIDAGELARLTSQYHALREDGADEYGDGMVVLCDEVTELLNDANDDQSGHMWDWYDGELFYQSHEWFAE